MDTIWIYRCSYFQLVNLANFHLSLLLFIPVQLIFILKKQAQAQVTYDLNTKDQTKTDIYLFDFYFVAICWDSQEIQCHRNNDIMKTYNPSCKNKTK